MLLFSQCCAFLTRCIGLFAKYCWGIPGLFTVFAIAQSATPE